MHGVWLTLVATFMAYSQQPERPIYVPISRPWAESDRESQSKACSSSDYLTLESFLYVDLKEQPWHGIGNVAISTGNRANDSKSLLLVASESSVVADKGSVRAEQRAQVTSRL